MADQKVTDTYYNNLGGINIKASDYSTGAAQFLALYNLDFDVPNALQKRPGSTQAVSAGTSGPVNSLFEFIKLDGSSYVIAGTDTAMFYLAANQFTLLSSGWNNGQPADMLTFVNKLWIANGQNFGQWQATTGLFSLLPAGLPMAPNGLSNGLLITNFAGAATIFTVGGATMLPYQPTVTGGTFLSRGVFFAYSYLRMDGYMGPLDFTQAINPLNGYGPTANGNEYFGQTYSNRLFGFTYPPNKGITSVAIWVAVDTVSNSSTLGTVPLGGAVFPAYLGNVGFAFQSSGFTDFPNSVYPQPQPNYDPTRFWLFTLLPVTRLFPQFTAARGSTMLATTLITFNFNSYTGPAPFGSAFSGMPFGFFDTNTPKYIEVNQNIMFMAGFSNTPSTVWFSDVGAPESIQPDSSFEVRTNDGDRVLALKEFQNQLMVFKETSFHKLLGNSADNFELVQLSAEYGCLSNRCVITYGNNIAWLDRKGIIVYNGASWNVKSNAIESIFRRMNLSAARENATAVNHIYRNQIWFGIPVDGSAVNNLTVVYDYLADAWTYFDGYNAASFAYVKGQLNVPTVWRGDYSGLIHYTGQSFYSDSGRAISCVAFTRFENFGGQNETSIWRRFFLDVAPAVGLTGQINGQVMSNYDHSTVQATFTIYQSQFQSRAEMGVVGKGVAAMLSHSSASLPLLINGYAWGKRPLRNV